MARVIYTKPHPKLLGSKSRFQMDILTALVLKWLILNTTTISMWNFVIWPSWVLAITSHVLAPINLTAQLFGNHTRSIMGKYIVFLWTFNLYNFCGIYALVKFLSQFLICFSERVHKGIKVAFSNICTTKYSADPEESKVSFTIRIYFIYDQHDIACFV